MKKILICFLILFIGLNLYSQNPEELTQTLRGNVVDKVTGSPLIGATVIISESKPVIGTVTDVQGAFRFDNLPLGRTTIEISFVGYQSLVIPNLLLVSGKEVVVQAKLEEQAYSVEELTIRPERKKEKALNDMALTSSRMFSVEETERFAGSLGDPAKMVANYAGVMTQNDSRNDIIIRGNSPIGVLWRLEGIEIPNPNHFGALGTTGGPVSMVNNNLLADSDFLTGAFPAEFGNALSGAFDLNLRSGNNQKTEFTGQIGFNGFEAGIEGPVKIRNDKPNPSYLANYRYSTLELLHKAGFNFGTGTAIPEYNDLTFLIDIPATKAGRFKIFGLKGKSFIGLGHDVADTTGNSYNAIGTSTDFGSDLTVLGISHNIFLNEKRKLKSTVSYQKTSAQTILDSTFIQSDPSPFYRSDQKEEKFSFSAKFTQKINSRSHFSLGFIGDFYNVNFEDSVHSTELDRFRILASDQGEIAMIRSYGQFQHKFRNNIVTTAGIHIQYSDINDELAVEPRLGISVPFQNNNSLSFGFGLHSQLQPKVIYFQESHDEIADVYFKTNKDLLYTRSCHFVAGYDHLLGEHLRIKLESYYQYLYNIPIAENFPEFSMINAGDQFGIPSVDSLTNGGKGENYGIELTLERFLSKGFYFLFTSSLFESKYTGYDKVWRNTAFNGNYVFNLLGGYEFRTGKNSLLTLDIKSVLAGGKRYIPIDLQASIEDEEDVRDWSKAYKDRYDPYFRTDLRIGLKMNGKKFSQEWGLDLQNIANYKSIFMEGYDVEKQEVYKVYQQGFVPMMLYRIQF